MFIDNDNTMAYIHRYIFIFCKLHAQDQRKTTEDCVKTLKFVDTLWRPPAFTGELPCTGQLALNQLDVVKFRVFEQDRLACNDHRFLKTCNNTSASS